MVYVWLSLAIVFEVGWALAMKQSQGLTRLWPSVATGVMYLLSVVFLAQAARKLDVGVAYAIWAGAGVSIIAIAGVVWFKEPATWVKAGSLALVVAGIAGLSLSRGGH
ncbi:MAG: QacE family quaternary ammonium compound efflux SMR transporter [Leptolyngbya sp. PLA1]|nr:QacE family quaternary ammonium compound efflux SMR transporter [Leptolyngbya sp. PLA1]